MGGSEWRIQDKEGRFLKCEKKVELRNGKLRVYF